MSELGRAIGKGTGAVAIVLLIVLLAEYELLRFIPGAATPRRRAGLLVAIVPLMVVFGLVAGLRISHIASTHP